MPSFELELAHCHFCPQSLDQGKHIVLGAFHFRWEELLSCKKVSVDTGRRKELGPMGQQFH